MSFDDHLQRGHESFALEDYEAAVTAFTSALTAAPESSMDRVAKVLVARSGAHLELKQYENARRDADESAVLDPTLFTAYFRSGTASLALGEFHHALQSFRACLNCPTCPKPIAEKCSRGIRKCEAELGVDDVASTTPASDTSALPPVPTPTVETAELKSVPETEQAPPPVTESTPQDTGDQLNTSAAQPLPVDTSAAAASPAPPPEPTPSPSQLAALVAAAGKSRITHEWYQSVGYVYITYKIKGLTKDCVQLEFSENSVSVTLRLDGNREFLYTFHLWGAIVPAASAFSVFPVKVEIKLKKSSEVDWADLEGDGSGAIGPTSSSVVPSTASVPAYPSSSRKKKDWNQIEHEVEMDLKNEKPEGEEALNRLLRDIYSSGTEETRRAMMKSFTESGGTVLSTNWSEVGKDKVKISPPTGMEAKKWDL